MDHKLWAGCKCECVRALWCVARLGAMHLLCAHGISSPANDACVHRTHGRWVSVKSGSILNIMKREPENMKEILDLSGNIERDLGVWSK